MTRGQVLSRLGKNLADARAWRERAKREFDIDIRHGTGIPHTCGGLAVRNSGQEYRRAIDATDQALRQYLDYFLHGTVPEELVSETEDASRT